MKQLKLIFFLTILVCIKGTQAFAAYQVANADGVMIYYTLINGNECEVTYQDDEYHYYPDRYTGNVVIPASVTINGKTYTVKRIGYEAFRGCGKLTSVTLPASVTYISESAFQDCTDLTSITLPVGLSEGISNYAFQNCTSLTSVIIPDGTTWLGAGAFQGCTSLATITVPNSVTLIGISALDGTAWYNNQPDGLVYAGKVAYKYKGVWPEDCHLVIENGTLGIANSAFNYSSNNKLTSVVIPSSITYIGTSAFYGCNSLVSVTVRRKTPVNIDSYTFSNRANAILYVPAGSKAAYESATYWKEFKKIVELSPVISFADANVKALCVANWDTDGDEELSEAEAAAVTDLGKVFKGNTAITSFVELKYFTGLTSLSNEAFSGCSNLTSITIPDNVVILGSKAFYKSGLTSISIPNSVEVFGDYAFYECGSLTTAKIGNGVTDIGRSAFCNCSNLVSVSFGTSVTSIGVEAFSGCSCLASITIPDGMVYIGMLAFWGCSSLSSVSIPNSVKTIGMRAFKECNGLTSVTISNGITTIDTETFAGCRNLTTVEIPNGVTSIGTFAFQNCSSLTALSIPNSVTTIANEAFSFCSGLTSVAIPSSVTSLGVAFTYCSGLTSISVDEGNPNYDSRDNCNAIIEKASNTLIQGCKNTVIPCNITAISECAFIGCSGLTSITMPRGITSIGDYAFNGCSGLTSVVSEVVTPFTLGVNAFGNIASNCTLTVPADTKAAYIAAGWTENVFKGGIIEAEGPNEGIVTDISQLENAIYVDPTEGLTGITVKLNVKMKNQVTANGCSFRLTLPKGFTLAKDDDGDIVYELSNRAKKMSVVLKDWENGTYDFALTPSTATATIIGTDDTFITLTLRIPEDAVAGDYVLQLTKNLIQSKVDDVTQDLALSDVVSTLTVEDYILGDVNSDKNVSPADAIMILYHYFNVEQNGFNAKAADVNGDGNITPADAIEVLYRYFESNAQSPQMLDPQ